MHNLTVRTRFTFGDRVRFDSATQRRAGTGKIFAITVVACGQVDYMVELDEGQYTNDIQAGILENEITLLSD